MIPKRLINKAYRLKRERKSSSCEIECDGRIVWVYLDNARIKLGTVKRVKHN